MGTEERREREKAARQEAIMASARELFFTKGFTPTTMDEIASKAELSKGALYLYFSSKEDLYVTVLNEGLKILFDRIEAVFQLDLPPDQLIRRFGEVRYRYYLDYREYYRIFFFRQHRDVDVARQLLSHALVQENLDKGMRNFQRFIGVIQKGIDQGIFAPGDPRKAAVAFWGAINGVLFFYEEELSRELIGIEVEELIYYTIDLFINALKKR
ncbi:MAG: TetR/AcrR family transcriptional regulator [Deltaproteobacteria bacterium]|nr:TetR/AcrR family transcriptional regulator [Deltaproteobacteria bacterium]